jgi:hypothetical protein
MPAGARHGMVQALYTSLIGHSEGIMAEALLVEYQHLMRITSHHLGEHSNPVIQIAGSSILSVFMDRRHQLASSTFDPLFKECETVFSGRFAKAAKCKQDLEAVRALRNVFVHGREAWLPLAAGVDDRIDTDATALKKAVDRLRQVGLLAEQDLRTQNKYLAGDEAALFNKLHSDKAVMHFYRAAKQFEQAMYAMSHLDQQTPVSTKLPDLESV